MRPKYPSDKKGAEYTRKYRQKYSQPCIDCGKLCTRGKRCRSCSIKLNWKTRIRKITTTIQHYGSSWQQTRKEIIANANGICQRCHKRPAKFVHHSLPIRFFSNLEEAHSSNNLIALCQECHTKEHQKLKRDLPLLNLLESL